MTFFLIELDSTLSTQLTDNPAFLVQGFSGIQPVIQQAMQDYGMSYSDFGHKGKGKREAQGKERGKETESSWNKAKTDPKEKVTKAPVTRVKVKFLID